MEKIIDYVSSIDYNLGLRNKLLGYYARWLKDIPGNVAECGVFRGEFAKEINFHFKERRLYLFDTFTRFDPRDIKIERLRNDIGFNGSDYNSDTSFLGTTIDYVKSRMSFPEKYNHQRRICPGNL